MEGAPWASEMLQAANGLISEVSSYFSDALSDLAKQADLFGIYAEEKMELLENTNKLLQGNNLLSPFVLFGETPTNYYDRTIHAGNIGTIGLGAISNYVDYSLRLPELVDTLGVNTSQWQAVA